MLTVMFAHEAGGIYIKPINFFPIAPILFSGPVAVSYLYVLSGFVMSLIYYRPHEPFKIRTYWSTRFVRVYPLYIVSFLLTCLYYYDFIARIKPEKILSNLLLWQAWIPKYSQSFNPASWSLSVEGFFYFVFPFFIMWAYRQPVKKLIRLSIILWIVSQTIHQTLWTLFFPAWEEFLEYFPLFHLSSFILGAVGGIWFVSEAPKQPVRPRNNSLILFGTLVLMALFLILGWLYPERVPFYLQTLAGIVSPLSLVIIITLSLDRSRLSRIMNHRWLVTLGETSYALYIFHIPVRWWCERLLGALGAADPTPILDVVFLPLMLLIGLLLLLYVDTPLRNRLRELLKRVSMPLLLLDLAAAALSIYLSFNLRFPEPTRRELAAIMPIAYAMFWCAFFIRLVVPILLGGTHPSILTLPPAQAAWRVLISVTVGSVGLGVLMLSFVSLGWLEGFPRSVLLIDWALMFGFSALIRLALRNLKIYRAVPAPA